MECETLTTMPKHQYHAKYITHLVLKLRILFGWEQERQTVKKRLDFDSGRGSRRDALQEEWRWMLCGGGIVVVWLCLFVNSGFPLFVDTGLYFLVEGILHVDVLHGLCEIGGHTEGSVGGDRKGSVGAFPLKRRRWRRCLVVIQTGDGIRQGGWCVQ